MNSDIREYARLGLVHHMLYPESMTDPDEHARTLAAFAGREDIETFDCCLPAGAGLPGGDRRRERLIRAIRDCGKEQIAFATHLFPHGKLSFSAPQPDEQAQVRLIVADMVCQAAAIGATGFVFSSGGPSRGQAEPAHFAAFADFCRWLCGRLKPHGITAMLEPFDTDIDKKYLYGPTAACVHLIESLAPEVDNLAIELDVAHLPLMGESFAGAIETAAAHLKRVHLGNCVLKDRTHPRYGDTHPPIGFDGGEIDVPQITDILRCLLEVGLLGKASRGCLVMEMTPWPAKTVEETIADSMDRLGRAWRNV